MEQQTGSKQEKEFIKAEYCHPAYLTYTQRTSWSVPLVLPASWETCTQVKKQQLEMDMEQQNGSKLWKEYVKAVYCHPAYLTYMQSTSREMLG